MALLLAWFNPQRKTWPPRMPADSGEHAGRFLLSASSRTVTPNVREMGGKAWQWRRGKGLNSAI